MTVKKHIQAPTNPEHHPERSQPDQPISPVKSLQQLSAPQRRTPTVLRQLQRTLGNRATTRLLKPPLALHPSLVQRVVDPGLPSDTKVIITEHNLIGTIKDETNDGYNVQFTNGESHFFTYAQLEPAWWQNEAEWGNVPIVLTQNNVTVTSVAAPIYSGPGQFTWPVTFHLNQPATAHGWIVQKIVYAKGQETHVFWEAWPVKREQTQPAHGLFGSTLYHDVYTESDIGGSSGERKITGTVAFYQGKLPNSFSVGNTEYAGDAYSSATQPDFWQDQGTNHSLEVKWDDTAGGLLHFQTTPASSVVDTSKSRIEFSTNDSDDD